MANEKHLAILRKGVKAWNKWRENKGIFPDLSGANLEETDLTKADLRGVNLTDANLRGADLIAANFLMANLTRANLRGANLGLADLSDADLSDADLSDADLYEAELSRTRLLNTDFQGTIFGLTIFSNLDLSLAKNLDLAHHEEPSTIGLDTIIQSNGDIPIEFLEDAGVPDYIIENMQYLVDIPAIQYYSCFISYSTKDEEFAHQLNDRMKREGLRVWFAPEEMKGGEKIHEQVYKAIRNYDKLILVLSEASMNSNWVQSEIRRARKHEREEKRRKLFPISLVPFGEIQKWELFEADEGVDLAREIREYYIPDFCQWKDYDKFNAEFEKLLKALRAED